MNTDERSQAPSSRWVRETVTNGAGPDARERQVLEEVLRALRKIKHGTVTVTIQDGKAIQVDTTDKKRL
ncbi:hypothetical protein AYO38_08155 [bacterium SCGC AG-212-C10]|nr:hypothetical protein AYO38_08155 [bacterium SCGC AG-212-C10]